MLLAHLRDCLDRILEQSNVEQDLPARAGTQ